MHATNALEQDHDKCIRDGTHLKQSSWHAVTPMLSVREPEQESSGDRADIDGRHRRGFVRPAKS